MSHSLHEDPLEYMNHQLSKVFGDQDWHGLAASQHNSRRRPRMDLIEKEKGFLASFEIPGMSKEEINVDIDNNVLTVSGEGKRQQEHEKDTYRVSERRYGQFARSFTLPQDVDSTKVSAKYENGLLHIWVPKSIAVGVQKIEIN